MNGSKATMQYLTNLKREGVAKTEALKKIGKQAVHKAMLAGLVVGVVLSALGFGLVKINEWFSKNELVFHAPIEVKTYQVVRVVERKTAIVLSEKTEKVAEIVKDEENKDLATYICEKFGVVECKTALAVAKAESGMRCDAVNVNDNGTADLSVFQLNTTHLKKGGEWTLANMAECRKNVDLAYELWQAQGWNPWVAYTNGNWLAKL